MEQPRPGSEPTFEKLRQAQETRNEIIANVIQVAILVGAFSLNAATRFATVAPYRAPASVFVVIAGMVILRLAIVIYLWRGPVYYPARKYVLSALDIAFFTMVALRLAHLGAYSWVVISLFNVCTYAMVIALSGLRYNTRLVVVTGVATLLLHSLVFIHPLPPEFRLPALMIGLLTQGAVTACAAYSVASLIRMHREAAMKDQLARFLPPELVDEMVNDPNLLQRKTERRIATVIFTDIRGFTRISERLSPEKVVEFLNEFLDEMTSAIMDHRGMLDKYISDAVMGVFGVPVHSDDHALRALRAAMDMQQRMKRLNARLLEGGLPALSIGIGLHTGELLFGAIGSTRRLDYTVIGDTVNVASRIEGMTRSYPVEILISDSTRTAIGDAVALHRIATVGVKNRVEPLTLWSPDPPREVGEEQPDLRAPS